MVFLLFVSTAEHFKQLRPEILAVLPFDSTVRFPKERKVKKGLCELSKKGEEKNQNCNNDGVSTLLEASECAQLVHVSSNDHYVPRLVDFAQCHFAFLTKSVGNVRGMCLLAFEACQVFRGLLHFYLPLVLR